jgi:hypothetical protein
VFQCSVCAKTFRLQNALNHHIATKHGGKAKVLSVGKDGKATELSEVPKPASEPPKTTVSMSPTQTATVQVPFPGLFSPIPAAAAPTPKATPEVPEAEDPKPVSGTADESDKKLFVCTVCQKTFRLEAALQHHYQAKHNMEMPSAQHNSPSKQTSTTTATSSVGFNPLGGGGGSFAAAAAAAVSTGNSGPAAEMTYTQSKETMLPQAPQYHLDVAPNAPEEGSIAAHWRCVNHTILSGPIKDLQEGYVFEDPVLQFVLITDFDNPIPGDPDKDFHTVRLYGETAELKKHLREGVKVMVTGRLRLVPQYEATSNKYYHYPVVMVQPGAGSVVPMA